MRRCPRCDDSAWPAWCSSFSPRRQVAADEPEIAVEASASEIFIGESVDYVVEIRNVKNPSPPDLSALRQDFDVVSAGDESHNQSSTFIINGRVTQQNSFGHAYRFRLTPKRTGKLVIPAPSATIDGKTVSGRALDLKVIAPEAQDLVVPEIKTDRPKVYPTQPFEVTLRVLVRPLPDDPDRDPLVPLRRRPPHIDVNWVDLPAGLTGDDKARWLEKLLAEDGSGFTLNDVTTRQRLVFRGTAAGGLQPVPGARKPQGTRWPSGQLLRLRAQAQAHRREGRNLHARPGNCERIVRRRDGRKQLHRPAAGRGRSRGVGGSARSSPSAAGDVLWRHRQLPPGGLRQPDQPARG